MTIWEELEEARKIDLSEKGEGGLVFWGRDLKDVALERGAETVGFEDMEDQARLVVEEYVAAPASRINRDLEMAVCDVVLKYLIFNWEDENKRGERAISDALGIPRTRLRSLLQKMEWDGIVSSKGIGTTNPYAVLNLGKALGEGYLRLGPRDPGKLAKTGARPIESLFSRGLASSLPESEPFTDAFRQVFEVFTTNDSPDIVKVPFMPGKIHLHGKAFDESFLVRSFLGQGGGYFGAMAREVLLELGVPESVTPEDVRAALVRIAGKRLRLTRQFMRPLIVLLEQNGYEKAIAVIEKAYLRDKLLKQAEDGDGRMVPRVGARIGEKTIWELAMVPGHGMVNNQTQELTPSHIRMAASIYRSACDFAEKVGVEEELVTNCRKEADEIESFLPIEQENKA